MADTTYDDDDYHKKALLRKAADMNKVTILVLSNSFLRK
mgnify:CR=1 FL=1|jgi:hypothetical protein